MHAISALKHRRGFTIIEMLVVVSVISLLIAILLPTLGAVRAKGQKTEEVNNLRQIGYGWNQYANQNNDAALPGFLSPEVQMNWQVRFRYPDKTTMGADPAGPWTWRLAPFFEYNGAMLRGYTNDDSLEPLALIDNAQIVAEQPAFAYNGYYLGGVWDMVTVDGVNRSAPRFNWAASQENPDRNVRVVTKTISGVKRASEMVAFTTAARLSAPPALIKEVDDDVPGWHLAQPPYLAEELQWGVPDSTGADQGGSLSVAAGANTQVQIYLAPGNPVPVPIGRYTNSAPVLYVDGSTSTTSPGSLANMRKWIDAADDNDWIHTDPWPPSP